MDLQQKIVFNIPESWVIVPLGGNLSRNSKCSPHARELSKEKDTSKGQKLETHLRVQNRRRKEYHKLNRHKLETPEYIFAELRNTIYHLDKLPPRVWVTAVR